jgi:hypothetical protein
MVQGESPTNNTNPEATKMLLEKKSKDVVRKELEMFSSNKTKFAANFGNGCKNSHPRATQNNLANLQNSRGSECEPKSCQICSNGCC